MECRARMPEKHGAANERRKRIRLYHLMTTEAYGAIKATGFRGEVYCARHPKDVWGEDSRDVLLEVFLDMTPEKLECYRVPIRWEDPSAAQFDHYYRIPPEVVLALGVIRRVPAARRQKYRLRGAC